MFYAGMWGSNIEPGGDGIEIDYYVGITPKWNWNGSAVTFNIAGLAYTYPGANDIDYFELKTGATWTGGTLDHWRHQLLVAGQFPGFGTESNAIEGAVGYAFSSKLFNFFSPTISGLFGFQRYEDVLRRLHLLECWPDARLHGALVC